MVDDLHDLRLLDAVYGLGFLIVVYQDNLFLTYIQESPPGNKAAEPSVPVQDREITELLFRHNFLDIIHIIIELEAGQRCLCHKIFHRDTLVDQPCRRKCIMRRADDDNTLLLRLFNQLIRHFRILAYHQAAGVDIHRTGLRLIPVSQDDQIVFLDKLFHQIRIGCANRHFSFGEMPVLVAGHQRTVQRFDNIAVLSLCS